MKADNPTDRFFLEEATESISVDYFSRKVLLGMVSGKIVLQNLGPDHSITSTSVIHAHESPVTSLDWAHPSFGDLFVSCEQAGFVRAWSRSGQDGYVTVFERKLEASRMYYLLSAVIISSISISSFHFYLVSFSNLCTFCTPGIRVLSPYFSIRWKRIYNAKMFPLLLSLFFSSSRFSFLIQLTDNKLSNQRVKSTLMREAVMRSPGPHLYHQSVFLPPSLHSFLFFLFSYYHHRSLQSPTT